MHQPGSVPAMNVRGLREAPQVQGGGAVPRDAKTVIGWAPLQPVSQAEPAWSEHHAPLSQPLAQRVTDPQRTQDQLPGYREAPQDEPPPLPPPPLLPADPDPQPADPQHMFVSAGSDAAALTVLDLPILDADAMADAPRRASFLQPTYLHLLGAIVLHVAGLVTQDDPEVYVEAEIALYASMVLMLWCVIRILRRAARRRPALRTAAPARSSSAGRTRRGSSRAAPP